MNPPVKKVSKSKGLVAQVDARIASFANKAGEK